MGDHECFVVRIADLVESRAWRRDHGHVRDPVECGETTFEVARSRSAVRRRRIGDSHDVELGPPFAEERARRVPQECRCWRGSRIDEHLAAAELGFEFGQAPERAHRRVHWAECRCTQKTCRACIHPLDRLRAGGDFLDVDAWG